MTAEVFDLAARTQGAAYVRVLLAAYALLHEAREALAGHDPAGCDVWACAFCADLPHLLYQLERLHDVLESSAPWPVLLALEGGATAEEAVGRINLMLDGGPEGEALCERLMLLGGEAPPEPDAVCA
jgi:hypothetical protein